MKKLVLGCVIALFGFCGVAQACPAGVPVQTLTMVNNAHATATAITATEQAVVDQSMQVRAAWPGTPCYRFGSGGWAVNLTSGREVRADGTVTYQLGGYHTGSASPWDATAQPVINVQTGALNYTVWVRALTHEAAETDVNPTDNPNNPEIADPVENVNATYYLDGLKVTDFVYPAYYFDWPGPWDQAHVLTKGR